MAKSQTAAGGVKIIAVNKQARFNYTVEDTFEAGLVLTGAEIKSIRQGKISLVESYIVPDRGELFLVGAHIKPYEFNASKDYDPTRRRKLLMHKYEITKLAGRVERKGYTLIPLKVYLKKGYAKLELALAKGKATPDKRKSIQERDQKREAERAMKFRNK